MTTFINNPPRSNTDKYVQPQLTRYHHSYRSPMSSEKLNLEAAQMRYDITRLYARLNQLATNLETDFDVVQNGSTSEIHSVSWISAATPTPVATAITSIQTISQSLERMSDRLKILEKGL